MALIAPSDLCTVMDHLVSSYLRFLGTSGSGYGVGTTAYGAYDKINDARTAVSALSDADVQGDVIPTLNYMLDSFTAAELYATRTRQLVGGLNNHVRARGTSLSLTSLDAYLTYYNVTHATKWQALMDPNLRDMWVAAYPSSIIDNANVFFEIIQGSTYTNALRKSVVTGAGSDTETAGTEVDSTKYAGGFPYVLVSGLTGTGTVTVTGTAFNPATGTTSAGVTWTASVTSSTSFALAPGTAPTDSLIVACSAVTIPAGISAGTIYVEARRPSRLSGGALPN
jgi:hypothetical protein